MLSLYLGTPTWLHRVPAGAKLLVLSACGTLLLFVADPAWLAAACALACLGFLSLGRGAWRRLRLLRGVVVAAVLIAGFHAWAGTPALGIASALRLVTAIVLATMLTLTTRFDDLLDVMETVLRPLQALGLPAGRIALALGLVLRFVENFQSTWSRLDDAHRARTGRAGGWRLVAPLVIRTLQTAERVAEALAVRLGR